MTTPDAGMRVCQIMECTIGGTRRHIRELTIGLARRGDDVTLIASSVRDATFRDDLAEIAAAGVEVIELPMRRSLGGADLLHIGKVAGHLLRHRYDVVHTHSSKGGAIGRTAALLSRSRARIVHTPHTFAFNFTAQFSPKKRNLFLGIERGLGRTTDALVHVGPSEMEEGLELRIVAKERAFVIPNGIDPSPYRGADRLATRRSLGVEDATLLVGAVGLLNEAKGHAHLIDAAEIVHRQLPNVRFVIAGEGALREPLQRQIDSAGLADVVTLLGFRRDIPELLAGFDLFCMPSLWEGMPYVVLEAMAAERPVIATDVNGCRDLVRDGVTGRLVAPESPEPLAAAILELADDAGARRRLALAGAELVADEYSLDAMIDRTRDLYRKLLDRR